MSKVIGVFVDVNNLYYCTNKAFKRKVDYEQLYKTVQGEDTVYKAVAYGYQQEREASAFISALKYFGFQVQYKKFRNGRRISWGVGITLDVVRCIDKLDKVILVSSEIELLPLVEWIKSRGIECQVVGCGIPREIRQTADSFKEIDADVLEAAEQVELPADSTSEPIDSST